MGRLLVPYRYIIGYLYTARLISGKVVYLLNLPLTLYFGLTLY